MKASCINSFALFLITKNYHGVGIFPVGQFSGGGRFFIEGGGDYHRGIILRWDIFRGGNHPEGNSPGEGGIFLFGKLGKKFPKMGLIKRCLDSNFT